MCIYILYTENKHCLIIRVYTVTYMCTSHKKKEGGERERGREVGRRDRGGEKRERDGERGREVILQIKEVCEGQ